MPGQRVVMIHPEAPTKPAHGAPCNGCGVCCLSEPCPLGMVLSGRRRGACAALRWNDVQGRYQCGALSEPASVLRPGWRWTAPLLRRLAPRWIAAGVGCDAHLEATPHP